MATLVLFLGFSLFLQGAFGEIICKELPVGVCSFSIESSGKRCVLEKYYESSNGAIRFQCKTSAVVVKGMWEMIESDECTNACGVDRNAVGISSDSLLDPTSTAMICSTECYQNCPNIIDLYYNLALGEGVYLPELCNVQRTMPTRRVMTQLLSSGSASSPYVGANGPISSESSIKVYSTAEAPM